MAGVYGSCQVAVAKWRNGRLPPTTLVEVDASDEHRDVHPIVKTQNLQFFGIALNFNTETGGVAVRCLSCKEGGDMDVEEEKSE